MADVFRPKGSSVWVAPIKVWNAKQGKFTWIQKSTGTTDKSAAEGIKATLEQASLMAKEGVLTRKKVKKMIDDILRIAGCSSSADTPSIRAVAMELVNKRGITPKTSKRYESFWNNIAEWAGVRADDGIDSFDVADMESLYAHICEAISVPSADLHLNFASMIFVRAMAHGHCDANPIKAVTKEFDQSVEKLTFSNQEYASILRHWRKKRRKDWAVLTALGWHSGQRIQDLLSLEAGSFGEDTVTFLPSKTANRGGRTVVLPLPRWLAKAAKRLGSFKGIHNADNRRGKASEDFYNAMVAVGIDPMPVHRGARAVNRKQFHSLRHTHGTRYAAAGVPDEVARLASAHLSQSSARIYRHQEIEALREAAKKVRHRKPQSGPRVAS